MFSEFVKIFLSKLPDRLVLVILVVSIISLSSFAYEHVGLPVQFASAETVPDDVSAINTATGWVSSQSFFGDHILPDTVNTSMTSSANGTYHMTVSFTSLIYKIDPITGGLHHIEQNHTVSLIVKNGSVTSAVEGSLDLMDGPIVSPMSNVTREYY